MGETRTDDLKAYMLSTLIFLATLVAIAAAQEHDSALGANEALFGTDLIQDLMSAENGKQLEEALDFTSSKTSTSTRTLGLSKGTYGNTDIGQSAFNQRFWASEHHIIKRVCSSCSPEFREVYYRRYTKLDSFDIYDTIKENWGYRNNILNRDFGLFSTYDNAKTWAYGWQYCDVAYIYNQFRVADGCKWTTADNICKTDVPGIGFPRNCGPKGPSSNQWNSWTRGGKDVAFYTEAPGPTAVPTHAPTPSPSAVPTRTPTRAPTRSPTTPTPTHPPVTIDMSRWHCGLRAGETAGNCKLGDCKWQCKVQAWWCKHVHWDATTLTCVLRA